MKGKSILILLVCLLTSAIIFGCGGGNDEGEDGSSTASATAGSTSGDSTEAPITTSSLSKPTFIKKVSPICARAEAQIFEPSEQVAQSQKQEEERVIQGLSPALESVADGIRGIGAPAGDEAEVEAIATAFQQAADEIEESEPSTFPKAERLLAAPSKLADQYGLSRCVFR